VHQELAGDVPVDPLAALLAEPVGRAVVVLADEDRDPAVGAVGGADLLVEGDDRAGGVSVIPPPSNLTSCLGDSNGRSRTDRANITSAKLRDASATCRDRNGPPAWRAWSAQNGPTPTSPAVWWAAGSS
jgi:hypothetical protein